MNPVQVLIDKETKSIDKKEKTNLHGRNISICFTHDAFRPLFRGALCTRGF